MGFCQKLKRSLKFLSLLKMEVCLLLCMFTASIKRIPYDQLLQDKICLQYYHMDNDYCKDLPELKIEDDLKGFKINILKDSTDFNFYYIIFTTLPSVIWSLFIGSWMDKYHHARKCLIICYSLGSFLEVILLGLNSYMFDWGKFNSIPILFCYSIVRLIICIKYCYQIIIPMIYNDIPMMYLTLCVNIIC